MRYALLLLSALALPCQAQWLNLDPWTREDTYRQTAVAVLQVVDWGQTRYIAKHSEFHEVNPLIGKHPSIGRVNNYFAISIPANIAISALVPSKYRALWQTGRLMVQVSLVSYNKGVGIGIDF